MNEQEWMTSKDPMAMLAFVRTNAGDESFGAIYPTQPIPDASPLLVSDRKLRLFACACCRQVWPLLTDVRSRAAVDIAEKYSDGLATGRALAAYRSAAWAAYRSASWAAAGDAAGAASWAGQSALLRDIVGNPWRADVVKGGPCPWLTTDVISIATATYEERARECATCKGKGGGVYGLEETEWDCETCRGTGVIDDGTLDPLRLGVLSDALEEAGCDNDDILCHLRGHYLSRDGSRVWHANKDTPHVRGCWVLDLLLGKE